MSDKNAKPAIPSWQRTSSPPLAQTSDSLEAETESAPKIPSQQAPKEASSSESTSLLEQASRFLEDPTIRDAPREKKVAFLQSKGVTAEDIHQLLEESQDQHSEDVANLSEQGEQAWAKTLPQPQTPRPQSRDVPPIVTYPEFLTQTSAPPPLITTQRLITTAYITGGLMATMYGLSKFIVAPMTQTLAESRHDFAAHAQEQLKDFNSRLGDIVTIDPTNKPKIKATEPADDLSEADSDPTELFHRDFGTQTTPTLSRRPSLSPPEEEPSTLTGHENRLKILTSHLRELEATRSNDAASAESLKTNITNLTTYLSEMSYQNQYYAGMGGLYNSNFSTSKPKDAKDDQMEVLKADIRAVKGVLLSARNFPAGGPRNTARAGP